MTEEVKYNYCKAATKKIMAAFSDFVADGLERDPLAMMGRKIGIKDTSPSLEDAQLKYYQLTATLSFVLEEVTESL